MKSGRSSLAAANGGPPGSAAPAPAPLADLHTYPHIPDDTTRTNSNRCYLPIIA